MAGTWPGSQRARGFPTGTPALCSGLVTSAGGSPSAFSGTRMWPLLLGGWFWNTLPLPLLFPPQTAGQPAGWGGIRALGAQPCFCPSAWCDNPGVLAPSPSPAPVQSPFTPVLLCVRAVRPGPRPGRNLSPCRAASVPSLSAGPGFSLTRCEAGRGQLSDLGNSLKVQIQPPLTSSTTTPRTTAQSKRDENLLGGGVGLWRNQGEGAKDSEPPPSERRDNLGCKGEKPHVRVCGGGGGGAAVVHVP